MTEKEFIIQLAVNSFNAQNNTNVQLINCDAKSIPTNQSSEIAYEVFTVRLDDFVRIRLYLSFGAYDAISEFKLEVDGSAGVGVLGDEVYVASGFVDRYYKESGLFKFTGIGIDTASWNIFLSETGNEWVQENGDFFILEGGA